MASIKKLSINIIDSSENDDEEKEWNDLESEMNQILSISEYIFSNSFIEERTPFVFG